LDVKLRSSTGGYFGCDQAPTTWSYNIVWVFKLLTQFWPINRLRANL